MQEMQKRAGDCDPHDEMSSKSRTGRPVDGPCSCVQRPGAPYEGRPIQQHNVVRKSKVVDIYPIDLNSFLLINFSNDHLGVEREVVGGWAISLPDSSFNWNLT